MRRREGRGRGEKGYVSEREKWGKEEEKRKKKKVRKWTLDALVLKSHW